MNMTRITYALIGLLLVFAGCKEQEKKTPSGMSYKILKAGDGVLPKRAQILVFHITTQDSKDSVWNTTYKKNLPGAYMITDSVNLQREDGFEQMFRMLSKGDSVQVSLPVTKMFREYVKSPMPPGIDTTLTIHYFIKVEDIMSETDYRAYMQKLMEANAKAQNEIDDKLISEYLAKNNIKAERDSSGIYYVMNKSNGKEKPTAESCVTVSYEGRFLDSNQIFDKNANISFSLYQVIRGWQLAVPMLGTGDSGTFYIPSSLAYGAQGMPGAIPPDAILVFDLELHKIGEFDAATRSCK